MCVTTHGPKLLEGFSEPPVKNTPTISATNNAKPIPIGAKKVALCFSAASIKIVKTRRDVRNISRKTPCAIEVLAPRVVETLKGPGRMADTTAAALIPASICAIKHRIARVAVRAPTRYRPRVTCRR